MELIVRLCVCLDGFWLCVCSGECLLCGGVCKMICVWKCFEIDFVWRGVCLLRICWARIMQIKMVYYDVGLFICYYVYKIILLFWAVWV